MPEPQQQAGQEGEEQIFAVLRAKRDKLKKLPPEMQALGLGAVFDEFVKPRLRTSGVSDKDMAVARRNFAKHMLGEGGQLPESFGQPPKEEPGIREKIGEALGEPGQVVSSVGRAAYGKAAGVVKNLADWDLMAAKAIGGDREARRDSFMKRLRDYAAKREGEVYKEASERSPTGAKTGALAGEVAMLGPLYEGGAGLIPKAGKAASLGTKVLSRAGRGAAGFAGYEAGRTTDPSEIGKAAATGAVAGPVVDPALEKLFGLLGKSFGAKAEQAAATQMKPSAEAAPAPTKFKSWMNMTPEEQRAYAKTSPVAQSKAAKVSAKPATTTTPKPQADTKEAAQWRQRQYVKLSKAGIRPVGEIKDKVQQGMTAEQILEERSGASTHPPKAEATAIPKAGGAVNTARESVEEQVRHAYLNLSGGRHAEMIRLADLKQKLSHIPSREVNEALFSMQKSGDVSLQTIESMQQTTEADRRAAIKILGEDRNILYLFPKPEASPLGAKVADTAIAQAENPQAAAAVKSVTKVAEGVHGAGALGRGQVRAETESEVRKKAIREAAPLVEKGIEHGTQEDAPGRIVPITRQGLSTFEALDALKAVKVPGKDIGLIKRSFEKYQKSGKLSDEDLRAGLEKTYQTIGQWMGIEGAENMSLEELFVKVTFSGRIH